MQLLKSIFDLECLDNQEVSALILKLEKSLDSSSKATKRWYKLIRIADKSEAGWAAVDEYSTCLMRLLRHLKMKRRSVLLSREL